MEIAKVPESVWKDLLIGQNKYEFEFLAFKILLARLRLAVSRDSNPLVMQKSMEELKTLFTKFGHLPAAQKDLAKITNTDLVRVKDRSRS